MKKKSNPKVLPLENHKALLFDDQYVDHKTGFSLQAGQLCPDDQPVLTPDRPWEAGGIVGDSNCTVLEHDGRLRMWYVVPNPLRQAVDRPVPTEAELAQFDEKTRRDLLSTGDSVLCHAVSDDGVNWEKPPLGLIDFAGRRDNNMLLTGRMGATVFVDPTDEPTRRFKLIHGFGPRLPHHVAWSSPTREIFHGIYGSHSPDGLHWTTHPEPIMPWYTDTTNVAYYDPRIGQYVAFVRYNQNLGFRDGGTCPLRRGAEHYRAVGRSQSADFFSFPPPEKIAEPSPRQRRPRATGMDYYNSASMIYPDAPDAYLMLSSNFYHEQDGLQVHLATSRDGIRYQRHSRPILSPGIEGRFDSRSIYMATGLVQRGGEIWLYYHGRDWRHGEPATRPRSGAIGRARLRLDGFASQTASSGGGELLTPALQIRGDRLTVNLDAGAGGRLKVELCDPEGRPLPGYGADDADTLYYNDVRRVVTWRGKPALPRLPRSVLRLRFIGAAVRLYAFQFQ